MEISIGIKLVIALALGAAIGLEREVHEKYNPDDVNDQGYLGVRSLSLITMLGTIGGLLFTNYFSLFLTITISFLTLLFGHYIFTSLFTKRIGITTELAVIYSYLIGFFIAREIFPMQLIIAITVLLVVILSNKDKVRDFTEDINQRQIKAFVGYAIIALVILPFLPDTDITLGEITFLSDFLRLFNVNLGQWGELEIFNPFNLWRIVALITGVDLAGYILGRIVGQKSGWLLSSLVGGVISSTATTQSIAQQSKETKQVNRLVGAAVLATAVSFIPTFLIVAPLNGTFVVRIFPIIAILFLSSLLLGLFFLLFRHEKKNGSKTGVKTKTSKNIFSLRPALVFAAIYLSVKILTSVALQLFGTGGFLAGSALAGLTGIDAPTINIADKAGGIIDYRTAALAFILVNAVNLGAKTVYSYLQGTKEFTMKYGLTMLAIVIISFAGLFFV